MAFGDSVRPWDRCFWSCIGIGEIAYHIAFLTQKWPFLRYTTSNIIYCILCSYETMDSLWDLSYSRKICSYSCLSIGPWNWQREVFSFLGFFYAWEDNIFIREWVIGLCPFLSTNHPFIQIGQWRNQFINNGWWSKTLACNYKRFKRCSNLTYCPQIWICFNCLCHGNLYLLLAKPKWRKIAIKCGGQVQQEQYATKNLQQLLLNCHIVQLLQLLYIGSCSFMFAFNDKQNFLGARQNNFKWILN